jgi:hypothetical protein
VTFSGNIFEVIVHLKFRGPSVNHIISLVVNYFMTKRSSHSLSKIKKNLNKYYALNMNPRGHIWISVLQFFLS